MSYTAWSVVFGEQPTAAKWNQLGANDAGFRDGTNFDNGIILNQHIAAGNLYASKLNNQHKFLAYHNTTQSLADGSKVSFNTEVYDTGSNFASSRFTAPVAGFYFFHAQLFIQSGSTGTNRLRVYKNGTLLLTGDSAAASGGNDISLNAVACLQLAQNDYVEINVGFSGGGSKTLYGNGTDYYTYFGGFLLSAI